MDEDISDSDETDSKDSDDKFQAFPPRNFNTAHTLNFNNINMSIPNSTYEDTDKYAVDPDGNRHQPLPTFPINDEDDDHGPVESGPL